MLEALLAAKKSVVYPTIPGGDELFLIDPSDQSAGTTSIIDRSSKAVPIANTGVVVADKGPVAGVKSLYFNNNALNYLRMPYAQMPNFGVGDFTAEYYMLQESRPGATVPLGQWAQIGGQSMFIMNLDAGGGEGFSYAPYSEAGGMFTVPPLSSLRWVHTAITRKGSLFTWWRDGKPIGSFTSTTTRAQVAVDWTMGLYMGRQGNPGQDNAVRFNGWLAKVRVYNRCKYDSAFTPS